MLCDTDIKCNYKNDVILENIDQLEVGKRIKKHVKYKDSIDIIQCHCVDTNKESFYFYNV